MFEELDLKIGEKKQPDIVVCGWTMTRCTGFCECTTLLVKK